MRTRQYLRVRHVAALASIGLALVPAAAAGATIDVTTTGDPVSPTCPSASNCSIREAVRIGVTGDVIAIPAGTYAITRGRMNVDAGVTLQGAGSARTVIDASASSPQDGIFRIRGMNYFPQVVFRDLAITDGTVVETNGFAGAGGGAIANRNTFALLVLDGVRLERNTATLAEPAGSAEIGMGGGAVMSFGSVQIVDSQFIGNTTTVTGSGGRSGGGAIMVLGDSSVGFSNVSLSIIDSTLRDNAADVTTSDTLGSYEGVGDGGGAIHANNRGEVAISGSTLTGNRATVDNSYGEAGGGALYVDLSDATISDSTLSDNHADVTATTNSRPASNHGGGAVYLDGTNSAFTGTTLSGNTVTVSGAATSAIGDSTNGGGAIYQYGYNLDIDDSTLSGNSVTLPAADRSGGGALLDNGESASITNTTFQGNLANVGEAPDPSAGEANGGGAILIVSVRRGVTLASVTIAGNSAPSAVGGGILVYQNPAFNSLTSVRFGGSIIADNTSSSGTTGNCALSSTPDRTRILSLGYNLATDAGNSCGFTATGDVIAQPQLSALADNGGPTATMALATTSPAVDAGDPAGCTAADGGPLTTDQRGAPRPAGGAGRCDIGAYESSPPVATTGTAPLIAETAATVTGTATNPDALAGTTWFEYGTTTAYGSSTPTVALAALTPATAQTATLSGLKAGTTYHFRAVTRNAVGTAYGEDQTFTTPAAVTGGTRVGVNVRAVGPWRISTRVTVGAAGTLRQVGTVRTRSGRIIRVCRTQRTLRRATAVRIACTISTSKRRAALAANRRVRLVTTFTPSGGKPVVLRNTVVLPKGHATPVTG